MIFIKETKLIERERIPEIRPCSQRPRRDWSLTCAPRRSTVLQPCSQIDHWLAHRAGLLFCNFFDMLTPVPYHHFFSSLILFFIYVWSLSFFTWCIWYINWSWWQSYITLSVLMFCDTDISSSFHCTAPECLELIWVGVSQEVYLNFHHFCG